MMNEFIGDYLAVNPMNDGRGSDAQSQLLDGTTVNNVKSVNPNSQPSQNGSSVSTKKSQVGDVDERSAPEEVLEFFMVEDKPVLIKNVKPIYPEIARKAGLSGRISVRFKVGKDGRVSLVQITKGEKIFRRATIDAVSEFVFTPAMQNDKPVAVWMSQMIKFDLVWSKGEWDLKQEEMKKRREIRKRARRNDE